MFMKNVVLYEEDLASFSEEFLTSLSKLDTLEMNNYKCIDRYKNAKSSVELQELIQLLREKCLEKNELRTIRPITLTDIMEELKQIKEMLNKVLNKI